MTASVARTLVLDKNGEQYLQWQIANPADSLDYYVDISQPLAGDKISNVRVSVSPYGAGELSIDGVRSELDSIQVLLSGGVGGRVYRIKLDVGTLQGREYSWVVILPVEPPTAGGPPPPEYPGFSESRLWAFMVLENGQGFWRLENNLGDWAWG